MEVSRRAFLKSVPAVGLGARMTPAQAAIPIGPWTLWYRKPASRWLDSLPVGNGRLGAMVFGGLDKERIALNESTVWSGSPNASNVRPSTREYLDEMRRLLFEGKYAEANALCRQHLCGREDSYGTHLPMANLLISQEEASGVVGSDYRRCLDLETALASVAYSIHGCAFKREVFASNPDQVVVVRIECGQPGKVSCAVSLDAGDLPGEALVLDEHTLSLTGSAWEKRHSDGRIGVDFETRLRVMAEGGSVAVLGSGLRVRNADGVTLLVAASTNFGGGHLSLCANQIEAAAKHTYRQLRERHIQDHQRLYRRVSIDLGGSAAAQQATDERLSALAEGTDDPQLNALFFQYARYLLIAGSREDSPLPMNLQGIWNDNLAANMVWTCDFHLDINTQQNYWPSEVCNLSECSEPLFKLVESIADTGRATARNMYGASGWVCHVYTNAWGFTAPGAGLGWGPFVTGGAWIASHFWEHYLYTRDHIFLEKRAWPVLKGAAEFFLDYMVEDPTHHWLVTGPSISPENQFLSPDGKRCSVSMGPTCDREVAFELFTACIEASRILHADAAFRGRLEAAREKLPPLQIGKHGQLQEWLEDFDEAEPNHRHTSHLLALYPFHQITPDKTPELAKAALTTIKRRTGQKEWEDVEWSRANLINFYARLYDGESAYQQIVGLLTSDTDHDLLTFSRAGIAGARENIFAIDGNAAGAAGMAETLLQSYDEIHFLPALPKAWPEGIVKGLRARGAVEVDIEWQAAKLTSARLTGHISGRHKVRYGHQIVTLEVQAGRTVHLGPQLQVLDA